MITHAWISHYIALADNTFHPAVIHFEDGEQKETVVYEYHMYDKRDALIIADVIRKGFQSNYEITMKREAERLSKRLGIR